MEYGANVVSSVGTVIAQIVQLIAANSATAVSGAIAQAQTVPFPLNLIALASSVGSVIGAIASVPKFADGGIAYGATLGIFGEYAGAQNNPEVVAPLDKLRSMIQPSGIGGDVRFVIEGRQLVGIMDKQNKINSRTR